MSVGQRVDVQGSGVRRFTLDPSQQQWATTNTVLAEGLEAAYARTTSANLCRSGQAMAASRGWARILPSTFQWTDEVKAWS